MTLHVNGWRPDTCTCEVEQVWDDAIPDDVPVFFRIIVTGQEHVGLNGQALFDAIKQDNDTKNDTLDEIEKQYPDIREPYIAEETGEPKTRMKWGIKHEWVFNGKDADRVLQYTLVGRTQSIVEKNRTQAALNTRIGVGRVNNI